MLSSCIDITSTGRSGASTRMCFINSTPLVVFSEMSTIARSTGFFSRKAIAAGALSASPATVRSLSWLSSTLTPCRVTGWSSTSRMRRLSGDFVAGFGDGVGFFSNTVVFMRCGKGGEMAGDACTAARTGIRGENAANHGGPIAHQAEAAAGRLPVCSRIEATTVVGHQQTVFAPARGERDANMTGLPVADGVVHRLLGDAVKMHGGKVVAGRRLAAHDEAGLDTVERAGMDGHFAERDHQARVLELNRTKPSGQRARLRNGIARKLRDRGRLSRRIRVRGLQPLAQGCRQAGQP